MGTYDFQTATADRIAEIFRAATIAEDGKEKKTGGQRRVLLADEVGLGKTHVAQEVIRRVRELRKEVNDDMFRVVYVCSNMSIANQNIQKLGIKNKADITESRLSMQHLTIREREARISLPEGESMGEIIIPLTPSTSFSLRGHSMGNANERALMAAILLTYDDFAPHKEALTAMFRGWAGEGPWINNLKRYQWRVARLGSQYLDDVKKYLDGNQQFREIREDLIARFEQGGDRDINVPPVINRLRRVFADLSLSMLEPDLIIMDEFQRFSSLLDYNDDSEQSAIVKKFFEQEGGQQPMILLLSATPYKPFSTLEELTEYNTDEHYEDFNRLMDFLFSGDQGFREVWADYSRRLSHLQTENFDIILASKNTAEEKMYEGMCRTERLNEGLVNTESVKEVPVSRDDILSFCEMQKIVQACREISRDSPNGRFHWSNMPIEYVKSSPYLLSFMDSYQLKRQIETIYKTSHKELPVPSPNVLLRERDIMQYHAIPMRNARLQHLRDMMLPKRKDAQLLLWVPASRPYYTTNADNPFVKNHDFSKTLVFSAWEMVPRMIAVMLTYEAEREVIFSRYKKASYEKRTGANRLRADANAILTFPSTFLASLYDPKNHLGEKLHSIKMQIRKRLEETLRGIPTTERRNYAKIRAVVEWLDRQDLPRPEEMPANTIDILTDMAIGGPGVCLYRILQDKGKAQETAVGFVTLFNRRIAGYIIDRLRDRTHGNESYLDGVMDYCVMGNLQAVLDEYHHLCLDNDDFAEKLKEAFLRETTLQVDTFESFYEGSAPKKSMGISYAVPFSKGKKSLDEQGERRSANIRQAFQSPFYPFVVATTSVGQEGLDFHWYCRKIVHWNLPSNPQDLEQREGRINRYKCLAIRRNLTHRYPHIYDWEELFEKANADVRDEFGNRYSEIVPNWCLPTEWIKSREGYGEKEESGIEWIERIVSQYPMSSDINRYRRLSDMLALYRLTLGQPRQEELLEMLEKHHLSEEQIAALLFNLSPIARK